MATKYARAAGGNWSSAGTWALSSGGSETTTVPSSSDDVVLDANSGNVVVDANSNCRSLDCTGYTRTLSGGSSFNLIISSSVTTLPQALILSAGMTYSFTGNVNFAHTTGSGLTITTNGKSIAAMTFTGVGGSWKILDALTVSGALTLTAGTLDLNSQSVSCQTFSATGSSTRSLIGGSSSITIAGTGNAFFITGSNYTTSLTSTTITYTNTAGRNVAAINVAFGTIIDSSGSGGFAFTGNGVTVNNLVTTAGANKTYFVQFSFATTIGSWTLTGNSAVNRVLVTSAVVGTPITLTVNSWTSISNTDFRDITAAGTASWNLSSITGGSGDCGGNSGISFTAATTQFWVGATVTGQWSDVTRWTSRVPLPQDNVRINLAFSSAVSIGTDMPRVGKNVDFTGSSWTGTALNLSKSIAFTIFGDLILADGMTHSNTVAITAEWREPHRIYMANTAVPGGIIFSTPTKQLTNAGAAMSQIGFNGGIAA